MSDSDDSKEEGEPRPVKIKIQCEEERNEYHREECAAGVGYFGYGSDMNDETLDIVGIPVSERVEATVWTDEEKTRGLHHIIEFCIDQNLCFAETMLRPGVVIFLLKQGLSLPLIGLRLTQDILREEGDSGILRSWIHPNAQHAFADQEARARIVQDEIALLEEAISNADLNAGIHGRGSLPGDAVGFPGIKKVIETETAQGREPPGVSPACNEFIRRYTNAD